MNRISTHVLDTAKGAPASGMPVRLDRRDSAGEWSSLCGQLLPEGATLHEGLYRVAFDTAGYFAASNQEGMYPVVEITFRVRSGESHFHIPLLLSPNGYTTYRGS